jgi:hypothetical protein
MRRESVQRIVVSFVLIVSVVGNLGICWMEWGFYQAVVKLPPGTEIRPMGLAFTEFLIAFLTFFLVVPVSAMGICLSGEKKRFGQLILLALAIALSLTPMPLGWWIGNKTIAATGVVIEE